MFSRFQEPTAGDNVFEDVWCRFEIIVIGVPPVSSSVIDCLFGSLLMSKSVAYDVLQATVHCTAMYSS